MFVNKKPILSERLLKVLKGDRIKQLLDDNNMSLIYQLLNSNYYLTAGDVGVFTQMLYYIGIDPLNYMSEIPDFYLSGSDIETFKVPSSITSIGDASFLRCKSLKEIIIEEGVKEIGS